MSKKEIRVSISGGSLEQRATIASELAALLDDLKVERSSLSNRTTAQWHAWMVENLKKCCLVKFKIAKEDT